MTTPIRWGILGAAKIAQSALLPAIQTAAGSKLVALATTSQSKALPFQAVESDLRVHSSYEALLADAEVDIIYIPLPNHLHVEWSLRAMAAGKHVLCEKPIAMTADEIDTLIAARDNTGLFCAEAFMVTHHPQWHKVRALIADGVIGELRHVDGRFTFFNDDQTNIRNKAETGGGGLRDIGVYPSITTRFVTGQEPTRLRADIERENGIDTFARVWAEFPTFTMSFYCGIRHAPTQQMLFHGSKGWIRLSSPFNARVFGDTAVTWCSADGVEQTERFNAADQYKLMVENIGVTLKTGAPYNCPLEMSRGNQAMIDAIFAADPA
jgi:predicted dehydrogenase